jgi:hypothetical protein
VAWKRLEWLVIQPSLANRRATFLKNVVDLDADGRII